MQPVLLSNAINDITVSDTQTIVERISHIDISKTITIPGNGSLHYLAIVDNADIHLTFRLTGEWAKANISFLFLSRTDEKVKGKVETFLASSHTSANVYLLSLLPEGAEVSVDGGIIIQPDIVKASWHLLEENVLLGKKVKIKTLPMLDVRSSDVSASHGAKIDRLDEGKLFYMMAKGLDKNQAQGLIVRGYITHIFDSLDRQEDPQQQAFVEEIMHYLENQVNPA